mmetsp:Transcript_1314/g.1683  ORF Transcript_1314/g.1683 Transcript_1314/m.1683 type:complete len:176 (-) Transcript_1314:32-559(-)
MDDYFAETETYYTTIEKANNETNVSFNDFIAAVFDASGWFSEDPYTECPEWIGNYEGMDLYNTMSEGGYGDQTSGVYSISSTNNYLLYGKHGTSTETNLNLDRNYLMTAARYVAITYIAKTSSVTPAIATGEVSIGTFDEDQKKYMMVEDVDPELCGSKWLAAGASLAFVVMAIL